jgi:hypothetical protein
VSLRGLRRLSVCKENDSPYRQPASSWPAMSQATAPIHA